MANSFASLKKSKSLDNLSEKLSKIANNDRQGDDRFWKPGRDKAGNGRAVIRFLPPPQGEEMPFIRVWDHFFQGPGGYYVENSLTTLGKDDPVSEYNSKLWNSGSEENKDIARKQKRRLSFYSNIYVIEDPANPDNEGKVFLYRYGKMIFDMLNEAMNPQFDDIDPINPFDFWTGANFNLRIRTADGYVKYDRSSFSDVGPLKDDDDELEQIWQQEHSLEEFIDPKNFKSYDELKAKLYKVLALDGSDMHTPNDTAEDNEPEVDYKPKFKEKHTPETKEDSPPAFGEELSVDDGNDDDDEDNLKFFQNLANEDED